ncbi:MAG: hypothetical protein WBQ94_07790 [Terracidiphilus sp.]
MTLVELSAVVGILLSIAASLIEAANARVGFVGYVLATIVGLAVGICSLWIMISILRRSCWGGPNLQQRGPQQLPAWQSICILIGMIASSWAWIAITGFLGGLASHGVLHAIF